MKIKGVIMMMALSSMSMTALAQSPLRSGIDLTDLHQQVNPGEDFYDYACGGWMQKNPLPAAYSRYGSFDRLAEDNNKRINGILKELQEKTYPQGSVEQKLSDLYKLAMDSARREKEGLAPAMGIIRKMEAAKTVDQLFAIQLEMMSYGDAEFFYAYLGADDKNASQNILNISQEVLPSVRKTTIWRRMRLPRKSVRAISSTSCVCSNSSVSRKGLRRRK